MKESDSQFWNLVAGKLHNELSPDENALLENELEDARKQQLFEKGNKIYDGLKEVKYLNEADQSASWAVIGESMNKGRVRRISVQLLKYAAILLVAFISGIYAHSFLTSTNCDVQYAEMEVMYGQTGHLYLFDGTEVWLNSGTKLKYPNKFNQNERDVFIEGEAFFKVKPNKKLPFKVKTGKLEVEVLGTSFNVMAYPTEEKQSIFLVEGSVQINNPDGNKIGEISYSEPTTNEVLDLISNGVNLTEPWLSPDGNKIIFTAINGIIAFFNLNQPTSDVNPNYLIVADSNSPYNAGIGNATLDKNGNIYFSYIYQRLNEQNVYEFDSDIFVLEKI